jgi:hypothetical protein
MKHDPLDTGGISEEHNETGAGPDYQHPPINRKELRLSFSRCRSLIEPIRPERTAAGLQSAIWSIA